MIWDVRVWSFFMWLVATCLYIGGFATPYPMPGNRIDVIVGFGGDVDPYSGNRIGLWHNVPSEMSGTINAVRVVLSIGLVFVLISFIGYILICKLSRMSLQIMAFVFQILSGVTAFVGIGIYRAGSDQLGEGFWMVTAAGGLYIINGIVLVFMPCMEYQTPQWKTEEDVPLTAKA